MQEPLLALFPLTFLLGMKHGLDADHLAAIDAMTRHNAIGRPRLARYAGALFAAGHGIVMLAVALGVTLAAGSWQMPDWLLGIGVWASIGILACLGLLNLRAAFSREPVSSGVVGMRTGILGRILITSNPTTIMGVGAFFALSFDTVGQAALMAGAARKLGGWPEAMLLTAVFVIGMCAVDALNGIWTARLVQRSSAYGRLASRIMAGGVGVLSLLIAGYGAATQRVPAIDRWSDGNETWLSLGLIACIAAAFGLGKWFTRQTPSVIGRLDVQH
ncbi:nickel transporter [Xylophilus sp. Kf1]|nr:nickel transporter [Xylophilus sp. Kf1]